MAHWQSLPEALRTRYWRASGSSGFEIDEIDAAIKEWITTDREIMKLALEAELAFAAGITDRGQVFLLWTKDLKYLTLTKEESAVVVKAIRAMFSSPGEPNGASQRIHGANGAAPALPAAGGT